MILTWTPTGSSQSTTLGNDQQKYAVVVEQLGGHSLVQLENLAGGANPALFPRGNISGDFVFRSKQSYADYQTTFTVFKQMYALLNGQGVVLLMQDTVLMTFANAILKGVQRIFGADSGGKLMEIRYTFSITTIT